MRPGSSWQDLNPTTDKESAACARSGGLGAPRAGLQDAARTAVACTAAAAVPGRRGGRRRHARHVPAVARAGRGAAAGAAHGACQCTWPRKNCHMWSLCVCPCAQDDAALLLWLLRNLHMLSKGSPQGSLVWSLVLCARASQGAAIALRKMHSQTCVSAVNPAACPAGVCQLPCRPMVGARGCTRLKMNNSLSMHPAGDGEMMQRIFCINGKLEHYISPCCAYPQVTLYQALQQLGT